MATKTKSDKIRALLYAKGFNPSKVWNVMNKGFYATINSEKVFLGYNIWTIGRKINEGFFDKHKS